MRSASYIYVRLRALRGRTYIFVSLPNFVIPHVLCSSEYFFVRNKKNNNDEHVRKRKTQPQAKKKREEDFSTNKLKNDDEFLSAKFIYLRKTSL